MKVAEILLCEVGASLTWNVAAHIYGWGGLLVSQETLRAQLKAIFWKTGTHRQTELVALPAHVSRLNSK